MIKNIYYKIILGIIILVIPGLTQAAWTEPACNPSVDPTACNVSAPINVSPASQTKAGNLILSNNLTVGGLIQGGSLNITNNGQIGANLGIGTAPINKLDVEGGAAIGAPYAGNFSPPTDGLIISGFLGVGDKTPGGYKLEVDGGTTDNGISGVTTKLAPSFGVYGSGNTYGVYGNSTGTAGVYGNSSNRGVWGYSSGNYGGYFQSTANYGVYGNGPTRGVWGVATNSNGNGVYGSNSGASGNGVYGQNTSTGNGVYGQSQNGYGVYGKNTSNNGAGVLGEGQYGVQGTGTDAGVLGESSTGIGVKGKTTTASTNMDGVYGEAAGGSGVSGYSTGIAPCFYCAGVEGEATDYHGVMGRASDPDSYGVIGWNSEGTGTRGGSQTAGYPGVEGYHSADGGKGVFGYTTGRSGIGVSGISNQPNSIGISGEGMDPVSGIGAKGVGGDIGVIGSSDGSYGVYCDASAGALCGGTQPWTPPSDERLKDNIITIDSALDKVKKLRGVTFTWKNDEYKLSNMGFIAQEVLEVAPELIREGKDGYYGMQTSQVSALLTEAIKEQQKQIEQLKELVCPDHPEAEICQ
ncbi:MAG: tail fiber domain-containing protein [Patescibacteria group bacterium]